MFALIAFIVAVILAVIAGILYLRPEPSGLPGALLSFAVAAVALGLALGSS